MRPEGSALGAYTLSQKIQKASLHLPSKALLLAKH